MRQWQQCRDEKVSPEIGDTDLASYNQVFASALGSAPPCSNFSRGLDHLPQSNNLAFSRYSQGIASLGAGPDGGVMLPNPAVGSRWGNVKFSGINAPGLACHSAHFHNGCGSISLEGRRAGGEGRREGQKLAPVPPRARPGCWTEGGDQGREVARGSGREETCVLGGRGDSSGGGDWRLKGRRFGEGRERGGEREGLSGGWRWGRLAGESACSCRRHLGGSRLPGGRSVGRSTAEPREAARARPPARRPERRAPSERAQPPRSSPRVPGLAAAWKAARAQQVESAPICPGKVSPAAPAGVGAGSAAAAGR